MKRKSPAFQFYPGDWLRDLALHTCSLAARGLWIDLLCLMWDGDPRGYLRVAGEPLTADEIAKLVTAKAPEVRRGLAELERRRVIDRDASGAYFSRRMIRDEEVRAARAEGGKLGGNPNLIGNHKVNGKVNLDANLRPTPASASSSSSASGPPHHPPEACESGGNGDRLLTAEREFERLWESFPEKGRKVKHLAEREWAAAVANGLAPPLADVLAALEAQKRSDQGRRGVWVNLDRWIHERRWSDAVSGASNEPDYRRLG